MITVLFYKKIIFIVYDFVWDRGSMVAINVEDREKYSKLIDSLLAPEGEILVQCVTRERGPPGAPHNLYVEDLKKFYPGKNIEFVEEYELDDPVKRERFGKALATHYTIKK